MTLIMNGCVVSLGCLSVLLPFWGCLLFNPRHTADFYRRYLFLYNILLGLTLICSFFSGMDVYAKMLVVFWKVFAVVISRMNWHKKKIGRPVFFLLFFCGVFCYMLISAGLLKGTGLARGWVFAAGLGLSALIHLGQAKRGNISVVRE